MDYRMKEPASGYEDYPNRGERLNKEVRRDVRGGVCQKILPSREGGITRRTKTREERREIGPECAKEKSRTLEERLGEFNLRRSGRPDKKEKGTSQGGRTG